MSRDYSTAHNQGHGEPWLITYADMVTLLMALFIVLLSVSTVDQQKAEEMVDQMKNAASSTKTKGKMTFQEVKKKVEKAIQASNLQNQVEARLTARGIDINFSSQLFFDAGKADLKPEALKVLDTAATILKEIKLEDAKISVEGHTDSRPIKTAQFPSNWELSTSRASRVLRYFLDRGVSEKKMEAMGLAATHPKVDKDGNPISPEDPANRRVVIRVIRDPYAGFDKKKTKTAAAAPPGAGATH